LNDLFISEGADEVIVEETSRQKCSVHQVDDEGFFEHLGQQDNTGGGIGLT
jgi:hypothetical protein